MSTWSRRPDVLWRRTARGVVVLGADADRPRAVNGPAASLWDALTEPIEERDAIDLVARVYEADSAVVARDLAPVLDVWRRDGAVDEST
jgi:hypothetical protein